MPKYLVSSVAFEYKVGHPISIKCRLSFFLRETIWVCVNHVENIAPETLSLRFSQTSPHKLFVSIPSILIVNEVQSRRRTKPFLQFSASNKCIYPQLLSINCKCTYTFLHSNYLVYIKLSTISQPQKMTKRRHLLGIFYNSVQEIPTLQGGDDPPAQLAQASGQD